MAVSDTPADVRPGDTVTFGRTTISDIVATFVHPDNGHLIAVYLISGDPRYSVRLTNTCDLTWCASHYDGFKVIHP